MPALSWRLLLPLIAFACSTHVGYADPISKFLDPKDFGTLKQADTKCPLTACGPTAAVNSFVFLQNVYPTLYIHNLAGLSYQSWIDTANTLSSSMNTQCCAGGRTTWENFYQGKETYIEGAQPGVTDYSAESSYVWNPDESGGKAKPNDAKNSVADNTKPTPEYIIGELGKIRDVEILIEGFNGNYGHYVTVTGMSWDPGTMTGKIDFVDPNGGTVKERDISITNGFISWTSPTGFKVGIATAVSEGPKDRSVQPTPEPGTLALMVLGLLAVVIKHRGPLPQRRR